MYDMWKTTCWLTEYVQSFVILFFFNSGEASVTLVWILACIWSSLNAQRAGLFLSGQFCSVHASPAPMPWSPSSTFYSMAAKPIRDHLVCRTTRFPSSQWALPRGSDFSVNKPNDFKIVFCFVVVNYCFKEGGRLEGGDLHTDAEIIWNCSTQAAWPGPDIPNSWIRPHKPWDSLELMMFLKNNECWVLSSAFWLCHLLRYAWDQIFKFYLSNMRVWGNLGLLKYYMVHGTLFFKKNIKYYHFSDYIIRAGNKGIASIYCNSLSQALQ